MSRRLPCLATLLLSLSGCTIPETLARLDEEAPPPELGRPGWVRFAARAGAVLGAIPGAVVSVAALPITYPISLLADEPLGYARQEFLFLPVSVGASTGHFVLGAPADSIDWVFHRAWVPEPEPVPFDHVPVAAPIVPPPGGQGDNAAVEAAGSRAREGGSLTPQTATRSEPMDGVGTESGQQDQEHQNQAQDGGDPGEGQQGQGQQGPGQQGQRNSPRMDAR